MLGVHEVRVHQIEQEALRKFAREWNRRRAVAESTRALSGFGPTRKGERGDE
jgi:hypothetical protein